MTGGLVITTLALGLLASTAHAARLIENREAALAYVDETFHANDCRYSQKGFFAQMVRDGVAPGVDDMAQPMIGTDKIIRQRRILSVMEDLFGRGDLAEDPGDPTIAISKFGGCA